MGRAATAGSEQVEGHEEAEEPPPAEVPREELKRRADIKFSGKAGAVVSSGGGAVTTAPTYGLAKDIVAVVEGLDDALFDRHAEHRPCGLLCRYGAAGMLTGDVLGLPLMPWVLAEPIGKAAAKIVKDIPGELKKAKKKAKRKGISPEDAAAAFLRRRVKLTLPTAAEIKATWRQISKAAREEEAAATTAAEAPPEPEPEQRERYTYAEENEAVKRRAADYMARVEVAASKEAALCIVAAIKVEGLWRDVYDREEEWEEENMVAAEAIYMHRMRKLQAAFPDWEVEVPERLKPEPPGEHNSLPCPWCDGRQGRTPWAPAPEYIGFCECFPRFGVRSTIIDTVMGPKFAW